MTHILRRALLLCLIAFPVISLLSPKDHVFASAEEDEVEGEEEAEVETEGLQGEDEDPDEVTDRRTDEDEEDDSLPKASPDIDTYVLFIKPAGISTSNMELPSGKLVEILVGLTNKGEKQYDLATIDASFRYPQDYSFYIQNFTVIGLRRSLKPKQQATVYYNFVPAESFSARPFGLVINIAYIDMEGRSFLHPVLNETVQIVELDEGLDGETFFLYLFLAALAIFLLVLGQQFLSGFGKKKGSRKTGVERGTSDSGDVDYEWLPKSVLSEHNKSPKGSPRQSPRLRKTRRGTGSDE